jgi:hypothetical protein
MENVERLIQAFDAAGAHAAVAWKLDILLDLGHLPDARVVPFLLRVLADPAEPTAVRIEVLKLLRNGRLQAAERPLVASLVMGLLDERSNLEVCLQAGLALGEFTEVPGVVELLGRVARTTSDSFDLRYSAFISIGRAGPTPDALGVLSQLIDDELLGRSAVSIVQSWRTA